MHEHESWPYIYTHQQLLIANPSHQRDRPLNPTPWLPLPFLLPMVLMYAILTCHHKLCPICFISGGVRSAEKAYDRCRIVSSSQVPELSRFFKWSCLMYCKVPIWHWGASFLNVGHVRLSNHGPMPSSLIQLLEWDHNWNFQQGSNTCGLWIFSPSFRVRSGF